MTESNQYHGAFQPATNLPNWPTPPTVPPLPPQSQAPRPDPGSPRARFIALIVCLIAIPSIVVLNQVEAFTSPPPPTNATKADEADPVSLIGKMSIKVEHWFKSQGQPSANGPMWLQQIEPSAHTVPDKTRVAIAAGELTGPEAATERLDKLKESIETDSYLKPPPGAPPVTVLTDTEKAAALSDIDSLKKIYTASATPLADDEKKTLKDRYGWWGDLALTNGLPETDPARAPLIAGGGQLIAVILMAGLLGVAWVLAGVGSFIAMIALIGSGRIKRRFVPPTIGGSVYLEVLAVFVACFLTLHLVSTFFTLPAGVSLGIQWCLALIPLWPLLRGVSFSEHRRMIGWHSGRGFWREVGCGLLGYFAGIPLLMVAFVISIVLLLAYQGIRHAMGPPEEQPKNEIVEILTGGSPVVLVLLFLLATLWAPFVEESVFRGALYRHLRSRFAIPLCAVVSAFVFGVMHGYQFLLLLPVMTLGGVFALMREWRGSLIAPMIAHGLHNGTLLIMVIAVFSAMK